METGGHDDEKTLDYIAANCDYALAEITIDAVDSETGNVTATGTASFANQPYSISIADGATVTLSGVTINGSDNTSCDWAGIGCGRGNDGSTYCGAILINGGAVTATAASQGASAIGNGNAATGNESFCASITFTTGITSLTLKNSRADFSPPAGFYLNAGQVMAHTVDITKSLSGYNSYLSSFNERNPAFSELFPHSTFDANTKVWNIAP